MAICDYDLSFLEEIREYLKSLECLKVVDVYSNKDDFLKKIKSDKKYDLVFIDEKWGDFSQLELESNEQMDNIIDNIPVILLIDDSRENKRNLLLLNFRLIGYLLKPVNRQTVIRSIEKIRNRVLLNYIVFTCHGKTIRLRPDEIIYIESHNHKISICTVDEIYNVYEKISDVKKRLSTEFVQCHKSFLVNLKHVYSLEGKEVIMKNGRRIPISRGHQGEMKKKVFGYIEEMI